MNKEELKKYHREWKRRKRLDPEYREKEYMINKKWRLSDEGKKYIKENAHKYLPLRLESNRRRILTKKGVSGHHSAVQWEWCKKEHDYCCAICGIQEEELRLRWSRKEFQRLTKDHIRPVSKGGTEHIWNIQPLCISCNARKKNNVIVGFTASAFDLFHCGHVEMIREARTQCEILIVGLHVNPQSERPSKNRPVQTTLERFLQLKGTKMIHEIIPYDTEDDLLNMLKMIHPDIRIVGEEYKDKDFTGKHLNIPIYYNKRKHGYSTSELRKRLC